MKDVRIAEPKSLIDCCWNAAVEAVQEWIKDNPVPETYSASEVGYTVMDRMSNALPFSAVAEARECLSKWDAFWHMEPSERGGRALSGSARTW